MPKGQFIFCINYNCKLLHKMPNGKKFYTDREIIKARLDYQKFLEEKKWRKIFPNGIYGDLPNV